MFLSFLYVVAKKNIFLYSVVFFCISLHKYSNPRTDFLTLKNMLKEKTQFFIGGNILLRQISLGDANDIFITINSQREYLRKWLPCIDHIKTVNDIEDSISSTIKSELVFVIHYMGSFAGLIGFKNTDKLNKRTGIGYWLSEKFQTKGIISQSVAKLIEFAFQKLDMHRVEIKCARGNASGLKIPQRLAFSFEGIERDGEFLNGNFVDLEVYSKLKTDNPENFKHSVYKSEE